MKIRLLLLLIVALMISGCSFPLKSGAPTAEVYRLSPGLDVTRGVKSAKPIHLYIPPLEVSPGLDTKKIVLVINEQQQSHVAESQWPDDLSLYLHSLIVDSFSGSHAFASVSNRLLTKDQVYTLLIKVSSFEVILPQSANDKAVASVVMHATVVDGKNQRIVWVKPFGQKQTLPELSTSESVKALNQALSASLQTLLETMVNGW